MKFYVTNCQNFTLIHILIYLVGWLFRISDLATQNMIRLKFLTVYALVLFPVVITCKMRQDVQVIFHDLFIVIMKYKLLAYRY